MSPHCNLYLQISKQSFCMTHQLMMMHHHTKFGYKRLSYSKDISQTLVKIFNLHCGHNLELGNPAFFMQHSSLWQSTIKQSGCIRIISSEDIRKPPYFSLYTPCDLDHEDSHILAQDFSSWWCITMPCLVSKGGVLQKRSFGQNQDIAILIYPTSWTWLW